MPYQLTIRTDFPEETDGGVLRSNGFEEMHLYFHNRERAIETADANTSQIRHCDVRFIASAPGPFEDDKV